MSDPGAELASGLADYLAELWGEKVAIEKLTPVTAGARRRNVLFEAHRESGEIVPLVLTQVPKAEVQIMPIEVETSCLKLAERADVPVAHIWAVSPQDGPLGGPFFLSSQIGGVTVPRQVLRLTQQHEGLGPKVARQCGEALARLHAAPLEEVHPAIPRPKRPAPEEAVAGMRERMAALLQPSLPFTLTIRWLERHLPPPPARETIVHGDVRNGNIIVSENGLEALLDWETVHIGDPIEDLAWLCQRMWRSGNDALEVGGFGTRADLRAGYEAGGGTWDEARFHWWKVYRTLWWGLGLAAQAAGHLDGSFRNIVMAASGRRVAELEWDALQLISPEV